MDFDPGSQRSATRAVECDLSVLTEDGGDAL